MIAALLLLTANIALPLTVDDRAVQGYHRHIWTGEVHMELAAAPPPVCVQTECRADLVHGLILDTARVGGGAFVDLWSTQYCIDHNPLCRESNPLGLSSSSRRLLKGAFVIGAVTGLHKIRRDGHPVWAKWLGRGLLAAQLTAATSNVIRAHRSTP